MIKNIIIRLVIYYVAWLLVLSGIFHLFPQILYYVAQERERIFVGQGLEPGADISVPLGNIQDGVIRLVDPSHTIPIIVALVLAFGVTLPITWVYRWTRPRKKYSQSFAHTLLVIPIAIALAVFLVKGSLALAFSLAGIVAAVRFRTSLEEPMDSVYMLMAIGIGLAAGTQLTTVAYLASLIFVVISLGVWKSNFGAQPAILSGWRIDSSEKLGEAPEKKTIATEKPYNAQIEVYTTQVDAAQKATTLSLESNTKRWQVADVIKNADGTAIVVFDVRLKKSVTLPSVIRDIEESGKGLISGVRTRNGTIAHAKSRR
jgi:hypothetical protein